MREFVERIDRIMLFFLIYTVIVFTFSKTLTYTMPFVLAFVFSLILIKPTRFLIDKLKMKNAIASLITTMILFAIIIFLLSGVVYSLAREAIELGKNAQIYISGNTDNISMFFQRMYGYYNNLDPSIVSSIESNIATSLTKLSNATVTIANAVISNILALFSSVPYVIMLAIFTIISTYHFTKDMSKAKETVLKLFPHNKENDNKILYTVTEAKKMIGNYIMSYLIIILITLLVTLLGFSILGVRYAVILSVLSAILDIMPVLGISATYIPVALVYIFSGNYFTGIGVLVLYVIAAVTRQIVEPKIVSSSLGVHPVAMLAALFIGLKANGFPGMLFCVFLLVTYNILNKVGVLNKE